MEWELLTKDVLLIGLGFIVTVLTIRIQSQRSRINNIESQLSEKKYKVYYEVFALIYDSFKRNKDLIDDKQLNILERAMDLKKDLIIYAPDQVLKKFFEWNNYIGDNPGATNHFSIYLDLMLAIRMDMGNKSTKVKKEELLRSFMTNKEEYLKIEKAILSKE